MNNKIVSLSNLERLKSFLDYEISASVLYFLSHFQILFLGLATLAALALTPYMLYVLYQNNKKLWIGIFIVIFLIPLIAFSVLAITYKFISPILFITLGLFYLYCFLLRFEVKNWCKEERHRREYLIKKKIKLRDEMLNNLYQK